MIRISGNSFWMLWFFLKSADKPLVINLNNAKMDRQGLWHLYAANGGISLFRIMIIKNTANPYGKYDRRKG